jgi:YVTN family beta-propeller protein
MFSIRTVLVCLGLLLAHGLQLEASDRVFLFGGSDQVPVLNAADLTSSGSITFPTGAFNVLAPPDGNKLYVVRANSTDTIAVVDPVTLNVTKTISLGVNASDAVVTPDGKYLLVAAGRLRVISTETDEEVIQPIPTGTAPTQILVNNVSTRAYVLASSGRSLHVISLEDFTILDGKTGDAVGTLNSIALSDDDSRLVAAATTGLKQFSASDLSVLSTTSWGSNTVIRGRVVLVPGSKLALVENGGSPPNVTSLLVNLDDRKLLPLGEIGNTRLLQITAVNETTAYAIVANDGLVKIDFTDPAAPVLAPVLPGLSANSLSLSPNHRFLFASSATSSRVSRIELETATVTHSIVASVAPGSHSTLFDPIPGPPAKLVIHGGDNQSVAPGRQLPVELSIRALSADGSPVVGQQILFSTDSGTPVQFEPSDLITTNLRGIASVRVTVPSLAAISEAKAALEAAAKAALVAKEPPASEQTTPDPIQRVAISASAGGVTAVGFNVNIVTQVGLVKLSGDHQVIGRGEKFPLPLVMLATDLEGNPLPAGTEIQVLPAGLVACDNPVQVDPIGIATSHCSSFQAGSNQNPVSPGNIIGDAYIARPELGLNMGRVGFSYNVAIQPRLTVEKLAGDLQTAPSGTKLPAPLVFRVSGSGIPVIAQGGIGVNIRQVSGPPVVVEPRFLVVSPGVANSVAVTLGPAAGTAVIEAQSSSPGLPSARFTVTSTGGQPQRLEKAGDNQNGRVGGELPSPLQVKVFNESNQLVPFPQVTWTVLEGDATVVPTIMADSSTARVLIGSTPARFAFRPARAA